MLTSAPVARMFRMSEREIEIGPRVEVNEACTFPQSPQVVVKRGPGDGGNREAKDGLRTLPPRNTGMALTDAGFEVLVLCRRVKFPWTIGA